MNEAERLAQLRQVWSQASPVDDARDLRDLRIARALHFGLPLPEEDEKRAVEIAAVRAWVRNGDEMGELRGHVMGMPTLHINTTTGQLGVSFEGHPQVFPLDSLGGREEEMAWLRQLAPRPASERGNVED